MSERQRRAKGEASRERLLDAAAEIAGERGYDGTSINLISERSGLPPSSIYWHFTDKDELIAAVIERSYRRWQEASAAPVDAVPVNGESPLVADMRRVGRAIAEFPDFLRLGLMLVLDRRPDEPTARRRFLEVRREAKAMAREWFAVEFAELDDAALDELARLTIAIVDGLFVSQQAGEGDLRDSFDLVAGAVFGAAEQLRTRARTR